MRVTLMHNPAAGGGEHSREWLESLLAGAGHEVRYQSTDDPGRRAAMADPGDLVVVAGGDGTVAKVLIELAASGATAPAAIIPLGSANNIARTLGVVDAEPSRLVRAWSESERRPFDLGAVALPWGGTPFVESFGGGIFADVLLGAAADPADPAGEEKHRHGHDLLVAAIRGAEAHSWRLTLDGRDLSGDFLAVEAMNIREVGPHLALAPGADPGDGLLDLVLVGSGDRDGLCALVEMPEEERPATPLLPVVRGRRLRAVLPAACAIHADDEAWPSPGPSSGGEEACVVLGERRAEVLVPAASR